MTHRFISHSGRSQSGDVGIYIALVMLVIIISAALITNTVLTRQVRLSREIANSERAFAAANSGYEQALFLLNATPGEEIIGEGEVPYPEEPAPYTFRARFFEIEGVRVPCVLSSGVYRGETRRLFTGPPECDFISS